jgi:hypothetical protein
MMTKYIECDCHSPEHVLRISSDEDGIYISVFLGELPLHNRIWNAILYVFGYKCKYGHFEEFVADKENLGRIISVLEELRRDP